MTGTAWALLAVTLVCAVANWVAVASDPERIRLVYVAKPATMLAPPRRATALLRASTARWDFMRSAME